MIVSDAPVNVTTTSHPVGLAGSYSTLAVGSVVSIHVTVASVSQVLPASSTYSKVNTPFHVNVY